MEAKKPEETFIDAPPPIMGSWKRLYLFVLILHTLLIFVFYLFTKAYS